MKNITKLIAIAALLLVSLPGVASAHNNDNNDGDSDRGNRFGIFGKAISGGSAVKSEIRDDIKENRKDRDSNFNRGDVRKFFAAPDCWK